MAKSALMFFLLCLLLITVGCGGRPPVTITAAAVFNIDTMTGQTWTFQNGYGDQTYISIERPPSGFYPGCTVWHYTKTAARAYWQPDIAGAELHFVMCRQPDGSWADKASLVTMGGLGPGTQDVEPTNDGKIPYLVIPALATEGQTITDDTAYTSFLLIGTVTWSSVETMVTPTVIPWRTDSSIEQVSTPVYSGSALVGEYWESFSGPCFPTQSGGCAHEKWYFAPGVGLVKVVPIGLDPGIAMERIR